MPGTSQTDRDRIEHGWIRAGFEDGAAGRAERPPQESTINDSAGLGMDVLRAYRAGYSSGREQYLKEQSNAG